MSKPTAVSLLPVLFMLGCSGEKQAIQNLDTSPRSPIIEPLSGAKVEARYKFTGVRNGEETQLAWKFRVIVEKAPPQPERQQPQSKGDQLKRPEGFKIFEEVDFDFGPLGLCLRANHKLIDKDGFTLSRHEFHVGAEEGEEKSWELERWVPYEAAVRATSIQMTPELVWIPGGCAGWHSAHELGEKNSLPSAQTDSEDRP